MRSKEELLEELEMLRVDSLFQQGQLRAVVSLPHYIKLLGLLEELFAYLPDTIPPSL